MTVQEQAAIAAQKGYLAKLNAVYKKIPNGTCSACTNCCSESVNMSYLEFLNAMHHCFDKKSFLDHEALPSKIMTYFIFELVKPMKCPFLTDDNRCYIYDYRPLPCRLFGNTTKAAYDQNYRAVLKQNRTVSKNLYHMQGIRLPQAVVYKNINFCTTYKSDKPLTTEDINGFYDAIVHLDGSFCLGENMSPDEMNDNLVGWFVHLTMGFFDDMPIDKKWFLDLRLDVLKAVNRRSSL